MNGVKIIAGTSNKTLSEEIAGYLGLRLTDALITTFSDGEIRVQINESIRGYHVYVITSLSNPVNHNLMELLLTLDAVKRSSPKEITAVVPYYAYGRQDRQDKPRTPISAKLVADLIQKAGANRVIVVDLHSPQIQGFFDIPVEHLTAIPVLYDYIRKNVVLENPIVVSPDAGGVKRARDLANKLGCGIGVILKRRPEPNKAEVMDVVGDIEGKEAIIVDDIIDTAGTLVAAANLLVNKGVKRVIACATHGIFSGPAVERLTNSPIEKVIVTNTLPVYEKKFGKLEVVSIAPLIGEAIRRIQEGTSVSSLFT
ncbi:ribose-phosphate diphosphokinase [Aquifex aeolicus]|uniref:Ribose-phosphate pyrophosphokinase n=1 Tax=Aquifex aeolicus (strain VF5) TaxID=224324 RepID=KPRS_AQUAE|nr:ribose-phosphate pyrophosphokinase [Aquifex aeolicus]O67556.1 RecName: Full=Ribose-phosphate pyrophosphokinase; Short=RPPK; AltName: Full=5-phospho-D-ribosyl alpha-1-diphosphate synthase; AltName: Full=Phosphoribosyl diphosphate synthase; AltName: Full=Phosphoribosyl pyrophosphate synthase; Short=P-Rib-PP synthase; Short=PRPP synthase; Short=PRPPase [Aquifex aeolicus VF5]AAC07513.1 phosphoribosylpyrophosphate synthetase [Aquifex aeolicus VF5]